MNDTLQIHNQTFQLSILSLKCFSLNHQISYYNPQFKEKSVRHFLGMHGCHFTDPIIFVDISKLINSILRLIRLWVCLYTVCGWVGKDAELWLLTRKNWCAVLWKYTETVTQRDSWWSSSLSWSKRMYIRWIGTSRLPKCQLLPTTLHRTAGLVLCPILLEIL